MSFVCFQWCFEVCLNVDTFVRWKTMYCGQNATDDEEVERETETIAEKVIKDDHKFHHNNSL